jgi:pimeloyl-ACP methyl ester carboxylesterase
VGDTIDTIIGYAMPGAIREDYLSAYEGDRFVESMRYVRSYPEELPILRDRLADIATPVHVINGAQDPVVPPVNAEYLQARLPNSKLSFIDAGHFIWELAPDEYSALVIDWWLTIGKR